MKVLNLYAGIGGNRKLWEDVEVTAVEMDENIAAVYQKLFPQDKVLVEDAHEYLLKNFKNFDFIWASPPCQSHSKTNFFLSGQGIYRYPDMRLYQEILFLRHWFKGLWIVENVISYYEPLIEPMKLGRHSIWSNFFIYPIEIDYQIGTMNRQASKESQQKAIIREAQIPELIDLHGLNNLDIKLPNKRQILRNCVLPQIGLHILNAAREKLEEPKPLQLFEEATNG